MINSVEFIDIIMAPIFLLLFQFPIWKLRIIYNFGKADKNYNK